MKTLKATKKRDTILAAAARVVAERGYSETTLAEIGEVAGTFAGSLYYYFPSKDALIEEVLNVGTTSVSRPVLERLDSLPEGASPWERIKTALDAHVEQMLGRNDFINAYWKIIDQVPEKVGERHRAHPRAYGNLWRTLIREGQAAGVVRQDIDPNLAQLFLLGATIYALDWYNPGGGLNPQQLSDRLADMFFRGIAPVGADLSVALNTSRKRTRPSAAGSAPTGTDVPLSTEACPAVDRAPSMPQRRAPRKRVAVAKG